MELSEKNYTNQDKNKNELFELAEKRKAELINSIITWLTQSPDSLEKELISGFFTIANETPTDKTVSAFQLMWYVVNDAKELKKLMQNEG